LVDMSEREAEVRPGTPADALRELLDGNNRFITGTRVHPHQDAERRAALVREQRPFAVVFGCSDSRLAAEIIFDRGLGDLFMVRTAGHIIGPEVQASIEYGVNVLGVPLLVVLGHDSCGAIRAAHEALTGAATPTTGTRAIVDRIWPSFAEHAAATKADAAEVDLDAVAATHVRLTVDQLTRSGIEPAVLAGRCLVAGMTYRLSEGRVTVVATSDSAAAVGEHSGQ
jgi:carbonic anhydrase